MSQHPSLRSSDKDKKHRSVLKRYERVKILKEKERWREEDTVFGLAKVKIVKFKVKKEKAAAAETTEGAGSGAVAAAGTAAPSAPGIAKGASTPAKGAGAKETPKAPAAGAVKIAK